MGDGDTEGDHGAHTRRGAVAFGPLKRALREHQYPVTAAELIEQYGGAELTTGDSTARFGRVLEGSEATRFRDPREVRDAVVVALGGAVDDERGDGADGESDAAADGETAARDAPSAGADDWSRLPP